MRAGKRGNKSSHPGTLFLRANVGKSAVEEAPTFVKKYVKNYFVSTVGQVDFSQVYIEK